MKVMCATGSRQGLKSLAKTVLLTAAAFWLAASAVFGASPEQRKRRGSEWDAMSQSSSVLSLGSVSALDVALNGTDLLTGAAVSRAPTGLSKPHNSVLFLDSARIGTINNRVGALSLGSAAFSSAIPIGTGPNTITNDNWKGGTGNWSVPSNWSLGESPDNDDNAVITAPHSVVAEDEASDTINNLTVGSGNSLNFNDTTALTIDGNSIMNSGAITLNSVGDSTELIIGGNVTLSGRGTLTLGNNASNFIFGAATGDTLTNNQTIQGSGQLGEGELTFVNSGSLAVVDADNSANSLTLNANGGTTNTGTLEATNGGTLVVDGTITNAVGTIAATGTNSVVTLNGATVTGGTLTSSSGGTILGQNSALLSGVTISAGSNLQINDNQTVQVSGTLTNKGTVSLNSIGDSTELVISGNVTLNGGGTVTLGNNANNFIFGTATGDTLTNQETIQGSGNIGDNQMTLNNTGTIDANQSVALTIETSGGTINTGTLEATAGGTLVINGTTVTNSGPINIGASNVSTGTLIVNGGSTVTGGTLTVAVGSNLQLNGGSITNGTLTNSGTITTTGGFGNVLGGGTFTNTGTGVIAINDNTGLTLQGGTYSNAGSITLNSIGDTTELMLGGNVTLTGGGTLTLSNNSENVITAASSSDVLTNNSTIQGSGNIGNGAMGLVNGKSILANQSKPLIIDTSASKGFQNKGTLSVSSGDTLDIMGGAFKNFAGTTLTGGTYNVTGTLQYNSTSDIATNAANITLTGASAKIIDQNNNNALADLTNNASTGKFTVTGGQQLTDGASAMSNAGTFTVAKSSNFTLSSASATYTQTGGTTTVDGTLTANGGITISGGSVFGNGGTLVGNTTDSGTLNIGDKLMTAGTESDTGTYTQTSTGTLNIDIGGTTAGTQFDQFVISSTASLTGTLNLDLINGFVPTLGEMFDILNASSVSGTFSTINTPIFGTNLEFSAVYNSNNVTLDVITAPKEAPSWLPPNPSQSAGSSPTPEPGSLVLLGSGLLGVAAYVRRRAVKRK